MARKPRTGEQKKKYAATAAAKLRYIKESDPRAYADHQARAKASRERNADKVKARENRWLNSERGKKWRKDYYQKFRDARPHYHRDGGLFRKFGLTLERYDAILAKQKGVCAICGKPETAIHNRTHKVRRLAVDHHHLTGVMRGLLCSLCNRGIGFFKGDASRMLKAVAYLEKNGLFSKEEVGEHGIKHSPSSPLPSNGGGNNGRLETGS